MRRLLFWGFAFLGALRKDNDMIIQVEDLVKRYDDIVAVNNVSINVKENEILGFLGPNGAGKSTTLNCILGLTKYNEGTIRIFGKDPLKSRSEVNKDIGYVPQDIAVFEELTAYENVSFFGRLFGLRGKKLEAAVQEALEFTGLWDRRKDFPKKYSGGMKRRLNIACAIVHKPKLLIMDEPTVGVDPQSRNSILESIKKLNERGTTVIYTSHYMEEIQAICSRIIIIDMGKVIAEGTKDSIISQAVTRKQVSLKVEGDIKKAAAELGKKSNVYDIHCEDDLISFAADIDANSLSFARSLEESGYTVSSMTTETPNLEMAFLSLTGKKLRD